MFPFLFAAAAGLQFAGSIYAARAQAQAQREAAAEAELQAQIAQQQAEFQAKAQEERGLQQAQTIRRQSARAEGRAITETAASGVEPGDGSPLTAIADQVWQDERAAGLAVTNSNAAAMRERASGEMTATSLRNRAGALRESARVSMTSGWLDAFASVVNAGAHLSSMTGGPASGGTAATSGPSWYADWQPGS